MAALPPKRLAAIAYAIYGIVYLVAAIIELTPDRKVTRHGIPWWFWYLTGVALILTLPVLIDRGWRKVTLVLAVLTGGRALYLIVRQARHLSAGESAAVHNWFLIAVAMVTCVLLLRAGAIRVRT